MKRILVCGGRDYDNKEYLFSVLDKANTRWRNIVIIHGAATGADELAAEWSIERQVDVECYPANWKQYGKRAGFIRNSQMLNEGHPDLVIAFPGGNGTAMMVKLAKAANISVIEIKDD